MVEVRREGERDLLIIIERDNGVGSFMKIDYKQIGCLKNLFEKDDGTITYKNIETQEVDCCNCGEELGQGGRIKNEENTDILFICDDCIDEVHQEIISELKSITPELIAEGL